MIEYPKKSRQLQEYISSYEPAHAYTLGNNRFVELRLSLIDKYAPNRGEVLDFAAGIGLYTEYCIKKDLIVTAIDGDLQSIAILKKRLDIKKLKAVVHDLSTGLPREHENRYGLIYSYSSLAYFSNLRMVLNTIFNGLKPQGIAILEFYNRNSLNFLVTKAYREAGKGATVYLKNIQETLQLVEDSEFEILETRLMQLLPTYGIPRTNLMLKILTSPLNNNWLEKRILKKSIDERISSLKPLQRFAGKMFLVVRKK